MWYVADAYVLVVKSADTDAGSKERGGSGGRGVGELEKGEGRRWGKGEDNGIGNGGGERGGGS